MNIFCPCFTSYVMLNFRTTSLMMNHLWTKHKEKTAETDSSNRSSHHLMSILSV